MNTLENKTILITGATDGLGRLLSINLAKLGASLIIHGRSQEKVDQSIAQLSTNIDGQKHTGIVCDFSDPESIEKSFEDIKKVDIIINNAGEWQEGATAESNSSKILNVTNINLTSPMVIVRKLIPVLQKSNFGQILNVSSIAGVEIPSGYYHTIYSATKFGLQAFTEALAKEFDNTKIRVMGYYPGGMKTKLFQKAGIDYSTSEPWMFDPQESVEAIIFMLTRDSKINIKRMDLINHTQG